MSSSLQKAWPHHGLLSLFVWLWGANFVLAEVTLREMAPISFSVSRFLVGGGTLLALLYGQRPAPTGNEASPLFPGNPQRRLGPPLDRVDPRRHARPLARH
jgi:EamA-like transporter family.